MRSLCAGLAVIALLALAGCGGSSSKSSATTTSATSTTPAKPSTLSQARLNRLDRSAKAILSEVPLFQSKLNRCVPAKRPSPCVKRVARPAEAAVTSSRKTFNTLSEQTGGGCSTSIQALRDRLNTLTEDLRAMTLAAQKGDIATFTRVGAGVQSDLRVLAAASLDAQKTCA